MAKKAVQLLIKHGCNRLLNDLRRARITNLASSIYEMPKIVRDVGLPSTCRRALVVGDNLKDYYFLETVCLNRAQQMKVFTDFDHALKWLFLDSKVPD